MKKALIIVDVQNDFCEGGSLEVPNANQIIPYINLLMEENTYDEIILTQDFHPADHKSFASNNKGTQVGQTIELNGIPQFMWPDHCVQGTKGAEFHPLLNTDKVTHIVKKGMNKDVDSYSGFQDNNQFAKTELDDYLKSKNIEMLEIVGLAMDYCVKYTCLDAVKLSYLTCLHFSGTKAVNVKPTNDRDAIFEMIKEGVTILA